MDWGSTNLFCQSRDYFENVYISLCKGLSVHGCSYGWKDGKPHGNHKGHGMWNLEWSTTIWICGFAQDENISKREIT